MRPRRTLPQPASLRRLLSSAKRLEDFDTDANIQPAILAALAAGDWVKNRTPVCLLGDSGTGNSHRIISLGTAATEAGYPVRYVLASRLVNEHAEAENDRELTRVIPATAPSTCSAWTSSVTCNWTSTVPNCSRF